MKQLVLQSSHYRQLQAGYRQYLQTLGYAAPTIKSWPVYVQEWLYWLEQQQVTIITKVNSRHMDNFIGYLHGRNNQSRPGSISGSYINNIISAVSVFARFVNSTAGNYFLDISPLRAVVDTPERIVLTITEIKQLYEATFLPQVQNPVAIGQRDRAIIAIFYGCGLRRQEGQQLNITDIDLNRKLIFVRKGKGNKQRYVPIALRHLHDIKAYLREGREWFFYQHYAQKYNVKYPKKKKQVDEAAFFVSHLGTRMIHFYYRLEQMGLRAGIQKPFNLHCLRHSIATHLLQSGMDIEIIARFLGHASLESTQIYTHLAAEQPGIGNELIS